MSSVKDAPAKAPAPPTLSQVEKYITFLTPVFAALSGLVLAWLAKHFPGVHIKQSQLIYAFLVGVAAVVLVAWKFLDTHGSVLIAKLHTEINSAGQFLSTELASVGLTEDEVKKLLAAHGAEISALLGDFEAKLPAEVQQVLQGLLKEVNLGDALAAKVAAAPAGAIVGAA